MINERSTFSSIHRVVLQLIDIFEKVGVEYMLVGSYSSNYYGRPRSTKDADFVVEISNEQLNKVTEALGPSFRVDRQMSFETITRTMRYIIEHLRSVFKIELFIRSADAHDIQRFARKRSVKFEGRNAFLPSPEDVVITKLRWSRGGKRSKDREDVAKVLRVRGKSLDLEYIRNWTDVHGTRDLFEALMSETQRSD